MSPLRVKLSRNASIPFRPLLGVYLGQESEEVFGSAALDHIAFHCTDLGGTMDHLKSKGVEFSQRRIDDDGSYQLFMFDPNGIKIELNFAEYEARGFSPELKASDLAE